MPNLASNSLSQLFTIPTGDWTMINKRVGIVLLAADIQDYISQYIPGYKDLLKSSQLWQSSTFNNLIKQSQALAEYASTAIDGFSRLNQRVKEIVKTNSFVPEDLKSQTLLLLNRLNEETLGLAGQFNISSAQVITFLNNNVVVDSQMSASKGKFDVFWAPISQNITSLESAAGLVTGEWQAISDDLKNTLSVTIDVTLTFLESLNIDAAIVCWQNVLTEAQAFPTMVAGQEQFWTNPF